jgi:hypothetical protein
MSIPSEDGTITAAYKSTVPVHGTPLKVLDVNAGDTPGADETSVTWNVTGPVGPTLTVLNASIIQTV